MPTWISSCNNLGINTTHKHFTGLYSQFAPLTSKHWSFFLVHWLEDNKPEELGDKICWSCLSWRNNRKETCNSLLIERCVRSSACSLFIPYGNMSAGANFRCILDYETEQCTFQITRLLLLGTLCIPAKPPKISPYRSIATLDSNLMINALRHIRLHHYMLPLKHITNKLPDNQSRTQLKDHKNSVFRVMTSILSNNNWRQRSVPRLMGDSWGCGGDSLGM